MPNYYVLSDPDIGVITIQYTKMSRTDACLNWKHRKPEVIDRITYSHKDPANKFFYTIFGISLASCYINSSFSPLLLNVPGITYLFLTKGLNPPYKITYDADIDEILYEIIDA